MSHNQVVLCSLLLRENYGDVVEKIGRMLMKTGSSPLGVLATESGLPLPQVKKSLNVLVQQNIVTFEQNKRGFIEYLINVETILERLRYPRYIYCAKTLYGDAAELIVEELLKKGRALMTEIVKSVMTELNKALQTPGNRAPVEITAAIVQEKFTLMVKTLFLMRCNQPVKDDKDKVVSMETEVNQEEMFRLPPMETEEYEDSSRKRKRSTGDPAPSNKRMKTDEAVDKPLPIDDGIHWRLNFDRFHHHFRDQLIINAVSVKIDPKAAEIVRTILRVSEVNTNREAIVTSPLCATEIFQSLSKDFTMSRSIMDQYLNVLSDDTAKFLTKVGESGGGMFSVNLFQVLSSICKAHIESVVQERFGSKCLRIFRVLLLKKHLEQKQIEEGAMIPAKEAKDLLYTMFTDNFITATDISKTPDHAPSRTFYLFTVDVNHVTRMLLDRSYKALTNVMVRREHEGKEHKRLLDKQVRVDAIAASLEHSGADPAQREEIEQMIAPPERAQLAKIKVTMDRLEQSELQLDDTISVFETYLQYARLFTRST